tara:strand:+ start:5931 stop:6038 length:108 start_codon:yes stop_codon:yes gene_type:complete
MDFNQLILEEEQKKLVIQIREAIKNECKGVRFWEK